MTDDTTEPEFPRYRISEGGEVTPRICPYTGREVAVVDFEFYYDQEYTLRDMPIAQFMLDPRFELMISGIRLGDAPPNMFVGDVQGAREWVKQFHLEDKIVVSHYAFIEGAVLEWKLGVKPFRYFCTLMGARPFLVPWTGSASLESLAEFIGAGKKGDYTKVMKGIHSAQATPLQMAEYSTYCSQDVDLTAKLYDVEIAKFQEWDSSHQETRLIDLTIKKFTRPRLMLDLDGVKLALEEVSTRKKELIEASGLRKETLLSDAKLATQLEDMGVQVPKKFSKRTNDYKPAFAKTDREFIELGRKNNALKAIVDARLAAKSTIEESRLTRFRDLAHATNNILPVPIVYYGAHNGRFAGADKLNLQNMGRGSKLRAALVAPPGHRIVAGDLRQIEARITATLAGQWDLVNDFRDDVDIYSKFASRIYNRPIDKKKDEKERFVGKTGILSLGYMAGAEKFYTTMNDTFHVPMTREEAYRVVRLYRDTYLHIPRLWTKLDRLLSAMMHLGTIEILGPLKICYQSVILPTGMPIYYRDLEAGSGGATYMSGDKKQMLFSGKLLENVVSALARIILTAAELRLEKIGLRAVLSVHDELVFVVRDDKVLWAKTMIEKHLSMPVSWMPRLPVACEVNDGASYLEAK